MYSKTKIIFHIGQAKTGTSAIQSFLNYNREKLVRDHKILYPNFREEDFGKGLYHNHATVFVQNNTHNSEEKVVAEFTRLQKYCTENKISTAIISWEGFHEEFWPKIVKHLENTLDIEVQFILYLKRQDLYLESAWKQWHHKSKKYANIHEYIQGEPPSLPLLYTKNWLQYFDKTQFIVKTFEKSSIGTDVVLDFLRTIGIEDKQGFVDPPNINVNYNYGLVPEVVELLKLCNHLADNIHHNQLITFVANILSDKYKKKDPFASYGFLSIEERRAILEKQDIYEREIAKLFFDDGRQKLFLESIEEEESSPIFEGLTLQNTAPIFMEILLHQQEKIHELQMEKEQWVRKSISYLFIDPATFPQGILQESEITKKQKTKEGLGFTATGSDPWFVFKNPNPEQPIKAVEINYSAPLNTLGQIFYTDKGPHDFTETLSISHPVFQGKNYTIFHLPTAQKATFLRFDPGTHSGKYTLHGLKIGY